MRIAVIGAGAMGSIYGGHLSQHNEVILVDTNQQVVEQINKNGLLVDENGTSVSYQPKALCDTSEEKPVDLVRSGSTTSIILKRERKIPYREFPILFSNKNGILFSIPPLEI